MAPDGETLWLGFRSPLTPLDNGDTAFMVAIENIEDSILNSTDISISDHHSLDLDGRAIRSITAADDGNYLITAGSADDTGNFAMYGWTGNFDDEPVAAVGAPPALEGWDGSYEATAYVTSLADDTAIRVIQDVGTLDLYGTGAEAQDLTREYMKFVSHDYVLNFAGAFTDQPAPTQPPEEVPTDEPAPTEQLSDPVAPVSGEDTAAGDNGSSLADTGATVVGILVLGLLLLLIGIAMARKYRASVHTN